MKEVYRHTLDNEWFEGFLVEEHDSIIDSLAARRILSVVKTTRGIQFVELCDEYYGCTLSREQCQRFIAELQTMLDEEGPDDQGSLGRSANSA